MGQEVKEQSYRLVGRLREVARPEKPRERLSLVLVSLSPSDRAFPLSHTRNTVSAPAVLCFSLSLGSLTRCLLVPFGFFFFFFFGLGSGFRGSFPLWPYIVLPSLLNENLIS